MARSLKIAGVERWSDLVASSLEIEAVLTYQLDTARFRVRGDQPTEGEEVIIEDGSTRLFGGTIVKVDLVDKDLQVWAVECDDYTNLLDRRLVVESYENQSASDIFLDIAAKYCAGFTTTGVRTGAPVIESITFDYKPVSECFKELCEYVGWHWQPTYDKDLQFFSAEELATPAPMTLEPGGRFRNLKHSIDTQGLRNRVYVRGGTMLSDPWTYETQADGTARQWWLPHKPHDISLTVGGVAKTVGIENVHEEADYDYMINFQEKYVRCSAQTSTPAQGTIIAVTYKYDIDVITIVEDITSQNAAKAVSGGDGVYEHVIVDDSLTTIEAAEAAGNADLREHANPRVKGSFETEISGWAPGQLVTINLLDRGISGTFLVQKVTITPATPVLWTYRVEYGGRLLGIADWLHALWKAQQKKKLNETALLHKFHYGAETAKVTDEVQGTLRTPPWKVEQGLEVDLYDELYAKTETILFDDFEDLDISDWFTYGSGVISAYTHTDGNNCIKKSTYADPNGGYKLLLQQIVDYEVVLYWNRTYQSGANANRIAIEDSSFNGYGVIWDTTSGNFYIEKRTNGSAGAMASYTTATITCTVGAWYTLRFRKVGSYFEAQLFSGRTTDFSNPLGTVTASDTTYSGPFDRFVVHGGYDYLLDNVLVSYRMVQFATVGSLLVVWQPGSEAWTQPQYRTSTDGTTWSAWQAVDPAQRGPIEVPYPGYVRLKANGQVQARNWKKPFDQTDVVCGFVMCSA